MISKLSSPRPNLGQSVSTITLKMIRAPARAYLSNDNPKCGKEAGKGKGIVIGTVCLSAGVTWLSPNRNTVLPGMT